MKLYEAVISEDLQAVKELLKACDVNEKDPSNGFTALHYCAQNGLLSIARLLLDDDNICIDSKDAYGNTPLFKAVFFSQGKTDMIKMLLSAGADPEEKNNAGVSPVSLAQSIANFDVTSCFE